MAKGSTRNGGRIALVVPSRAEISHRLGLGSTGALVPLALAWLALLAAVVIFGPWIAPHDPNAQSLMRVYRPPLTPGHLLGTDGLGRDVLSRLVHGTRVSLTAGAIGTGVAALIGVPLGVLAAFFRGAVDPLANFLNDALMTVPSLILALSIVAVLGTGLTNAMIAIGIVISPSFYRLARAATLEVRSQTYIEASISLGASTGRVILLHVLPNILTPIVIQVAVVAGTCIMAEAALSYLGLGVEVPTASWGSMLSSAARDVYRGPYLIYFPGVAIIFTVLALGTVGNWIRDLVGNAETAR